MIKLQIYFYGSIFLRRIDSKAHQYQLVTHQAKRYIMLKEHVKHANIKFNITDKNNQAKALNMLSYNFINNVNV